LFRRVAVLATLALAAAHLIFSAQVSAQEIKAFYIGDGADALRLDPGEAKSKDELLLRNLLALRLSVPAKRKLQALLWDLEWRSQAAKDPGRAESAVHGLNEMGETSGALAAFINLSIGDYFWTRAKEVANFRKANIFYSNALRATLNSPYHIEKVTRLVVAHTLRPGWKSGGEVSYGSAGNFLSSKPLAEVTPFLKDSELKTTVTYLRARSMIQEGADDEQICEAFEDVIAQRKKNPLRALALFDFSQFLSFPNRCPGSLSSEKLLQMIVAEFRPEESLYVERARKILSFETTVPWDVTALSKRMGETGAVSVNGPKNGKARIIVSELGLLTEDELDRRKVAQGKWVSSPAQLFSVFTHPFKKAIDRTISPGPVDEKPLPSGPYRVELPGKDEPRFLIISDLMVLARMDGPKVKVMSVSLKTGTPLPDVELELHRRLPAGLRSERRMEKIVTDSTGLAEFPRPRRPCRLGEDCDPEELFVVAKKFRHVALLGLTDTKIMWPFEEDPLSWVVLSEQTVKPGTILSWNLLVRPDFGKRFIGAPVSVQLHHPKGAVLTPAGATIDEYGRAGGVIRLGQRWSPGSYSLEFRVLSSASDRPIEQTQSFEIIEP